MSMRTVLQLVSLLLTTTSIVSFFSITGYVLYRAATRLPRQQGLSHHELKRESVIAHATERIFAAGRPRGLSAPMSETTSVAEMVSLAS